MGVTVAPSLHCLALALIVATAAASYGNALGGEFVLDDVGHIEENEHIRMEEISFDALREAAVESIDPRRPLSYITLAFNYYWGQYQLFGYRLFNIVVHVFVAALVYTLALLTFGRFRLSQDSSFRPRDPLPVVAMATVAALIFVAHPIQIQAVTYTVQRMTSLATLFYLLSLVCYIRARLSETRRLRMALWCVAALSWLFALASKQIAISLPIIVLLYETFFFRDLERVWCRRAAWLLALAIPIGVGLILLALWTTNVFDYSNRDFTMGERVLTQFRVVALYISLVLLPLPSRLNISHHLETSRSLIDPPATLACAVALAAIIAIAFFYARRQRLLSFSVLWFFANLALESSILSLVMIFEHRLYLPMVGVALGASYLIFSLAPRRSWLALATSALVICALATASHYRNRDWNSALRLWGDAAAKGPNDFRAHYDYATALVYAGRASEAVPQFERATQLKPDDIDAQASLGVALSLVGELEAATKALEVALRLDPDSAERHYQLASIYRQRGKLAAAIARYGDALARDPNHAAARADRAATQAQYYRSP